MESKSSFVVKADENLNQLHSFNLWDKLMKECDIVTDLHTSASLGDVDAVVFILTRNGSTSVNNLNSKGWTALMYASYYDHMNVVEVLLKHGVDVNAINKKGCSALILAALCGNLNIISLLLKSGVNIEQKDENGWSALFHAVYAKHIEVVKYLLKNKANPNVFEYKFGFTPLMLAAHEGHDSLVHLFIQAGVNIGQQGICQDTARSIAVRRGHSKVVVIIDSHIFQVNEHEDTKNFEDLKSLLDFLQLSKYYSLFDEKNINLSTFLTLSDADLKTIGVNLLGPRRKMTLAISDLQKK